MIRTTMALVSALFLFTQTAPALAGSIPVRIAGGVIDAPDTVDHGDVLEITLSPESVGRIALWGPITGVAGSAPRTEVLSAPIAAGRSLLEINLDAGSYELRLIGSDGAVLARALMDVSAAPVTLSLPDVRGPGSESLVIWRGPAAVGDVLQVVDPNENSVLAEIPALGEPGEHMETSMTMPARSGAFELRYVSRRGAVLDRLAFEIDEAQDWLRSPLGVKAGKPFSVEWVGTPRANHVFRIVSPETGMISEVSPNGTDAILTAPRANGPYRVEYVDRNTGTVASSVPLDVDD